MLEGLILRRPPVQLPLELLPAGGQGGGVTQAARCSPRAMLLIRSTRSRAAVTAASCSSVSSGGALRPASSPPAWPPGPARPGPPARQTAFWPPPAWSGRQTLPLLQVQGPGEGGGARQTGRSPRGQRRGQRRADRPGCSPAGLCPVPASVSRTAFACRRGLLPPPSRPGGGSPPPGAAISSAAARAIPGQQPGPPGRGPPRPAQGQDCGQGQRPAAGRAAQESRAGSCRPVRRPGLRTGPAAPGPRSEGGESGASPYGRAPVPPARGPRRRPPG